MDNALQWHVWEGVEKVPMNTQLLVEVVSNTERKKFQVAYFTEKRKGGPIVGTVGDRFSFDREILLWASLENIL